LKYSTRVNFPHTGLSSFYKAFKTYITDYVYEFNTVVLGTFQKAIQVIAQNKSDPKYLAHGPFNPIFVMIPTSFEAVPQKDFTWNYTSTHPMAINLFQRVYDFQTGVAFNISTRRMTGNIDFRAFADSAMEANDITMAILNGFRGLNRFTPIEDLQTFVVFNEPLRLMTEQGAKIIDWNQTGVNYKLFEGLGTSRYYLPLKVDPIFMLQSLSDMSNFYGGDMLPEFAVGGSIMFEIELPAIFTLVTEYDIIDIGINIDVDHTVGDPEGSTGSTVGNYDGEIRDEVVPSTGGGSKPVEPKPTDSNDGVIIIVPDNDDDMSKYAKILYEDTFEFCAVNGQPLQYPLLVSNISFNLTVSNYIILINNVLVKHSEYDVVNEYSVSIKTGPLITEGCITVRVLNIGYIVCRKKAGL